MILDNRMFDDESLECKSFVIATHDDASYAEWDYIKAKYPEYIQIIEVAVLAGKNYIVTEFGEIQWD